MTLERGRPDRTGLLAMMLGLTLAGPLGVHATAIPVTTAADDVTLNGNCTLREAVLAANGDTAVDACPAGSGADVVSLPAGVYALAIAGMDDDAAASGDLDLTGDVEIAGAGTAATVIDGAGIDRLFHVLGGLDVSVRDLTIRNGYSDDGGGILNLGGRVTLLRCTVTGNRGVGVASNGGALTVTDSTLTDNACNFGTGSSGCAVFAASGAEETPVVISGSTITRNRNQFGAGGSVELQSAGDGDLVATIRNTTISGNLGGPFPASSSGGIILEDGFNGNIGRAFLTGNNLTIVENTAIGIFAFASPPENAVVTLTNTILAGNGPYDCEGNVHSSGHNIVGDAVPTTSVEGRDCQFTAPGDRVVADPLLGPLAANGGPTETHALEAGSPARNAGHPAPPGSGLPACEATDQRGVARFICDIGAVDEGAPASCAAPLASCRAVDARLVVRDKNADGPGDGDRLLWKWRDEPTTVTSDLGDPTASTDYTLCVFDGGGAALVAAAIVPAGETCGARPCWRTIGGGYKYVDRDAEHDGIKSMTFRATAAPGSATLTLRGIGGNLDVVGLPLVPDVRVQLGRSDGSVCWESSHAASSIRRNTAELFNASE